jgi:hypothetical protein
VHAVKDAKPERRARYVWQRWQDENVNRIDLVVGSDAREDVYHALAIEAAKILRNLG